jgi:hypothetical protein
MSPKQRNDRSRLCIAAVTSPSLGEHGSPLQDVANDESWMKLVQRTETVRGAGAGPGKRTLWRGAAQRSNVMH